MCSAQYGCVLWFLHFVASGYVAQVFSEWFWDSSSRPCFTGITLGLIFHVRCAVFLCILGSSRFLSWAHFWLLKLCDICWPTRSFSINTDYDVQFIIIIALSLPPLYRVFTRMSPRQTMSLGDTLLQLLFRSIISTVYGAYFPRSYVGSDGLLRQHFPENVCSA